MLHDSITIIHFYVLTYICNLWFFSSKKDFHGAFDFEGREQFFQNCQDKLKGDSFHPFRFKFLELQIDFIVYNFILNFQISQLDYALYQNLEYTSPVFWRTLERRKAYLNLISWAPIETVIWRHGPKDVKQDGQVQSTPVKSMIIMKRILKKCLFGLLIVNHVVRGFSALKVLLAWYVSVVF